MGLKVQRATLFRRLFLMTARGLGFLISSRAPLREGGSQEINRSHSVATSQAGPSSMQQMQKKTIMARFRRYKDDTAKVIVLATYNAATNDHFLGARGRQPVRRRNFHN